MPQKSAKPKTTENISFRITQDMHRVLEQYARTQKDEIGQTLSASMAARRLFTRALQEFIKEKELTALSNNNSRQ